MPLLVLLAALVVAPVSGAYAETDADVPRLRSDDRLIVALVERGLRGSPTFRDLYERLERSNVIVYLHRTAPGLAAPGYNQFVARAGAFRFVRITLAVAKASDNAVALLGHELQHAMELADAPAVTDATAYERLYERIGYLSCPGQPTPCFETGEAVRAGRMVRLELKRKRPPAFGAAAAVSDLVRGWLRRASPLADEGRVP